METGVPSYYRFLFKYRRWTAGLLATGLMLNKGLTHVFPRSLFMPIHAELDCGKYSFAQQVQLLGSTKKDLGIKEDILVFVSNKAACHCAGFFAFSKWRQSPVIGYPKYFFCNNIFEVDDLDIKVGKSEKPLDSNGGPSEVAFLESLLLSEKAKKFCVAQQLFALKGNWAILQTLISPFFVCLGYIACFHGLKVLFSSRPTSLVRIIQFQIVCIIITWILCRFAKTIFNNIMVSSVDRKTAMVSEQYAAGGVEYCEKSRSTNKAHRALLGQKGESMFTAFGNQKTGIIFNWVGPSLTERQKYFEKCLQSFRNKS